jgi:hypothetical protein
MKNNIKQQTLNIKYAQSSSPSHLYFTDLLTPSPSLTTFVPL